MIPIMMIAAPMILFKVMASPNSKAENKSTKIKLVPLNIYAVESGILAMTCCQSKAYTPITPIAPAIHSRQGHDSISCREAIFVQMEVQA